MFYASLVTIFNFKISKYSRRKILPHVVIKTPSASSTQKSKPHHDWAWLCWLVHILSLISNSIWPLFSCIKVRFPRSIPNTSVDSWENSNICLWHALRISDTKWKYVRSQSMVALFDAFKANSLHICGWLLSVSLTGAYLVEQLS